VQRLAFVLLLISTLVLAACGEGSGMPTQPGKYTLKEKSVTFDGDRYAFYWADATGALHRAATKDVRLQLDEQNNLEITADKHAILHLKQEEPVTVEGRDHQGDFGNFWYPFMIGSMLSRGGGPVIINNQPLPPDYRSPVYRYPPTDRFDRGDTIGGSVTADRPTTPDYSRLPPVSGTVAGQSGGTGGGNAATNKADTAVGSSGQAGGSGAGSAAIDKSGSFKSGSQGYTSKVDSGALKPVTGGSEPRVGGGASSPSISTGRSSSGSSATTPKISTGGSSAPARSSAPKISTGRRR
jgi:hypothetical protein